MKSKIRTAAVAAIALVASIAMTAAPVEAKPIGFGGPHFYHHHHGGFGFGLGALALGSALAGAAAYSSSCYYVRQRVFDDYGDFVGYRNAQVCN
jgi:hypothetical protein